jgi:DNA-binding beta-propeller fold protein YncE
MCEARCGGGVPDTRRGPTRRELLGAGAAVGANLLGLDAARAPAAQEQWDLLVGSCWEGGKILRFDGLTGEFKGEFANQGELECAEGDAIVGRDGLLYVTNFSPGRIDPVEESKDTVLQYDPVSGEFVGEFARPSPELDGPHGLAFGPDGNLYVGTRFTSSILQYEQQSGEFMGEFVRSGDAGLEDVSRVVFRPDGYMYAVSYGTASVMRWAAESGEFVDEFIQPASGDLSLPHDIFFGPDGFVYLSSWPDNRVLRYDGETGEFVDEFIEAGGGDVNYIGSMTVGPDGAFYLSSCINNRVVRFDPETGEYLGDLVESGAGGLNGTTFILFVPVQA